MSDTSTQIDTIQIDTTRPGLARMYDYLLGGSENHLVDRTLVDEIAATDPGVFAAARANRDFLIRAVTHLTEEAGIRQFLDIGSGLPTQDNVHAVAQAIDPAARVVYVDNDPTVAKHAESLVRGEGNIEIVLGDVSSPQGILDDPRLRRLIDFDQPVALLLVAVLHFVPDSGDPWAAVRLLVDALPSGSYLVLSHVSLAELDELADTTDRAFEKRNIQLNANRTKAQISRFFDGLDLLEPGLVETTQWRSAETAPRKVSDMVIYAGVARKN
ncbi:SAM-dependent methyltransferase [Streptomyces sp. NPDC002928]|uniref:SAM-dependent methyltransferase n=1 Tax=Streptomyces sp. NPDC002928 TaxID=3154440 RepID=UPI0033B7E944